MSHQRPAVCGLIGIAALGACGPVPPQIGPEPVVAPPPALPSRAPLGPGDVTRLTLESHVFVEPTLTTLAVRDVVIPRLDGLSVARDDVVVSTACYADPCVYPHVFPTERLALSSERDLAVLVRPLPPPLAVPLTERVPIEVVPSLVRQGDPRGLIADAVIQLAAPSAVVVESEAVDDGRGQGLYFHDLSLYGGSGAEMAVVHGRDSARPEYRRQTWKVGAGTWILRVSHNTSHRGFVCSTDAPFEPPAWCDEPIDPGPRPVRLQWLEREPLEADEEPDVPAPSIAAPGHTLRDEPISVDMQAAPTPLLHTVQVVPGNDVVISWLPREASLGWHWKRGEAESWGGCHEWPQILPGATFDALELSVANTTTPLTVAVELTVLAPPKPTAELSSGKLLSVTTRRISAADPRGAFADVWLVVDEPGEYLVTARPETGTGPAPRLELLGPGDEWSPSMWNVLGSAQETAERYVIHEAGRFRLRVDGGGECSPRAIRLELERVEAPMPEEPELP